MENSTQKTEKSRAPLFAIVPFFLVLVFFAVWSFLDADNAYSYEEARSLAQRPVFDLHQPQAIIDGLEDYAVDQFPARSKLLKAYSALELGQRKAFSRDVYLENGWLFSRAYKLTDGAVADLARAVERVAERLPTLYEMLSVKNYLVSPRPSLHVDDASEQNRQNLLSAMESTGAAVVDAAGAMAEQPADVRASQWYATDFHWNADGAYFAAERLLETLAAEGLAPSIDLSDYVEREEWQTEYGGDLARRFSYLIDETQPVVVYSAKNSDELRYYRSLDGSVEVARSAIVASGRGAPSVDYSSAYTENSAYFRVENPSAPIKMRVVVFKDSLENAMTDILSAVFGELVVVDARYAQSATLDELLDGADAAVFMFHQNNAAPDTARFVLGE